MSDDVKVGKAHDTAAKAGGKPIFVPFQKRKQLERDIEHITAEMYKRNRELAETNKTLSLLRAIDSMVLESHATLKMVCTHIAEAITQSTDYPFAGLLTRSKHNEFEMALNGSSAGAANDANLGPTLGLSKPIHVKLTHTWFDGFGDSKLVDINNLTKENLANFMNCSKNDVEHLRKNLNLKSLYILKLFARRQIVGILVIGFSLPGADISKSETDLIDRLSEGIGVALDNKLLFEENQRVLKQLKESNFKLLALDEAKDDFISMASHQLRTPLTSVKGYVSMVLEGDAGKVNPQQKQLLTQAFFSSQRMVYLIADLLNVSRLRTGKFIVDKSPVNLADVVEQEVDQLIETAESRNLKLTYKKPKHFSEIMLDDTKIRQVVMNFMDNAIYYTPTGGRINIDLKETPATIELRVEDNGIGVPRSEKHHLFTKFYRAGNARNARPDGTGLGLFMAKKVVIAQGGALIFESQEGKGSTFGFIFSKAKLKPPEIQEPVASTVHTNKT